DHIVRVVRDNIFDVGDGARGGGEYIVQTLDQIKRQKQTTPDDTTVTARLEEERDEIDVLCSLEKELRRILRDQQVDQEAIQSVLNRDAGDYEADVISKGDYVLQVLKEIEAVTQERKGKKS
ncbi:MAG TPA: hypothetical protein VFD19_04695, partial [Clostridia bacterium]|nr:hypothetical protein [Clostridia bacterium]